MVLTSPTNRPMIISTTSISISVKPRLRPEKITRFTVAALEIPGADVSVVAFAAGCPVRAVAENVDLAAHPRIQVLVDAAPGILGQPFDVAALFPVERNRCGRRFGHQRLQSLLGRRIALIVQPVEL